MASTLDAALTFAAHGDWARVVPAARQALAGDPDDATAHALLALGLAHLERGREAVEAGRSAVALAPELAFAHYAHGWALLENRRPQGRRARGARSAAPRSRRRRARAPRAGADPPAAVARGARHGRGRAERRSGAPGLRESTGTRAHQSRRRRPPRPPFGTRPSPPIPTMRMRTRTAAGCCCVSRESRRHSTASGPPCDSTPTMDWARVGIIEAMKARNGLYRLILRYSMWAGSLSTRAQWFLIVGLYFGSRIRTLGAA